MATTVYEVWETFQKPMMAVPFIELDYESLTDHELWIPPEERRDFKPRQWQRV